VIDSLALAARLLLALLLVAVPPFALIDSADLLVPGISDGSDSSICDDSTRKDHAPLGMGLTPQIDMHPVLVAAPSRLPGREIPRDLARRPPSSRSPPPL
jgi:hypothetical protein